MTLAEKATPLRRKIASGQLVLSVGEWQTVMEALDMVSGESDETRQRDITALIERVRR